MKGTGNQQFPGDLGSLHPFLERLRCNATPEALDQVHSREMIARVILGEQKFVNTEAPRAIAGLHCFHCKTPFAELRSFKCHNWAYAMPGLLKVLHAMNTNG
jgi:hypothetical protein